MLACRSNQSSSDMALPCIIAMQLLPQPCPAGRDLCHNGSHPKLASLLTRIASKHTVASILLRGIVDTQTLTLKRSLQ